jgi:hypothetical protein
MEQLVVYATIAHALNAQPNAKPNVMEVVCFFLVARQRDDASLRCVQVSWSFRPHLISTTKGNIKSYVSILSQKL